MKVYGLVPAYNEERNISEVVRRLRKARVEPIVIDDKSKDRTYEIAKNTGAIVLRHSRNMGKAEAIRTGLRYLEKKIYDYVLFIDADLQYNPEESSRLLKPLIDNEADFVAGARDFRRVPFFRHRLGNFVWRTGFNILFGSHFKDTNCGFVGMTKDAARIMKNHIYGGYILENSMFIQAMKAGLRIKQVPVAVNYRHRSHVGRGIRVVASVTVFILKEGLKYRLRIK